MHLRGGFAGRLSDLCRGVRRSDELLGRGGRGQVGRLGELREGLGSLVTAARLVAFLSPFIEPDDALRLVRRGRALKLRYTHRRERPSLGRDDRLDFGEVTERRTVLRSERLTVEQVG